MQPPKIALLLDWDSTLTKSDTLAAIASIPKGSRPSRDNTALRWWQAIIDAYICDFGVHRAEYRPQPEKRLTVQDEIVWLQSLADVERRSFERAKSTERFAQVDGERFGQQVNRLLGTGQVLIREDWHELFTDDNVKVAIVSVNWSRAFIRECLKRQAMGLMGDTKDSILRRVEEIEIAANEIFGGLALIEEVGVYTSKDKADASKRLAAELSDPKIVVYIGDSVTDLDSLLAADIGICLRDVELKESESLLIL